MIGLKIIYKTFPLAVPPATPIRKGVFADSAFEFLPFVALFNLKSLIFNNQTEIILKKRTCNKTIKVELNEVRF